MKTPNRSPIFIQWLLLLLSFAVNAQSVQFTPDKPTPSTKITLSYDPKGTPLEGIPDIIGIAYLLDDEQGIRAVEIPLSWQDERYTGQFSTNPNTKIAFVLFGDAGLDHIDNNKDEGYYTLLYNNAGEILPGSSANLARAYQVFSRSLKMKSNPEKAFQFAQQELQNHPESKNNRIYYTNYIALGLQLNKPGIKEEAAERISYLMAKKKATEAELQTAHSLSLRLKKEDQAQAIAAKIRKSFPKGAFVKWEKIDAFDEAEDPAKQEAIFTDLEKNYLDPANDKFFVNNAARALASNYIGKDWTKFNYYINKMYNEYDKARMYFNAAWDVSGGAVDSASENLQKAMELELLCLNATEKALENPSNYKPGGQTEAQFLEYATGQYGIYADFYATLLYRAGNYDTALRYQTIVVNGKEQYVSNEMYERYAIYLEQLAGAQPTIPYLEDRIRQNQATANMKAQHRRLCLSNDSKEQLLQRYVTSLQNEAEVNKKEKLKADMLDEVAPDFQLVNLQGQPVRLADLKGKVVVLDFWATWCGPCLASFPAMQNVVNEYKDREDVVFLFINTLEKSNDKQPVNDLVNKNNYTFEVLLDEQNNVSNNYKVQGLPTKMVLDGNGRIRFKNMGSDEDLEKVKSELKMMIELASAAPRSSTIKP